MGDCSESGLAPSNEAVVGWKGETQAWWWTSGVSSASAMGPVLGPKAEKKMGVLTTLVTDDWPQGLASGRLSRSGRGPIEEEGLCQKWQWKGGLWGAADPGEGQ